MDNSPTHSGKAPDGMSAERSHVDTVSTISETSIGWLVDRFYDKIRKDAELGPVFERAIAADQWPVHLATMRDFWSSVMLTTGRYKGNPLVAHMQVEGIRPELFQRWLELFSETADELFEEDIAAEFRVRSERIARSLQAGLFYRPELGRPRAAS